MLTAISMKEVSPTELKKMMDNREDFQLIDLREDHEVQDCTIGGKHIPMGEIITRVAEVRKDVPVIMHCRSGKRASAVIYAMEAKFGFTNLYNLSGGIVGWSEQVDPTMIVH
jgi:rhodanese-related sulfurtransferase